MNRAAIVAVALVIAGLVGVPSSAAPATGDEVISLVQMDNVPLTDALRQVARQARLNVILDPRLSEPPYKEMAVSVRWENVTAKEALIALLDNYGLVLVESTRAPAR